MHGIEAILDDDFQVVEKVMSILPDSVGVKRRRRIASILRNHLPAPKSLRVPPSTKTYRLSGRPWFRMHQDLSHALILMHLTTMAWEIVMFTLQETIGRNRGGARIGSEWLANSIDRSMRNVRIVRGQLIDLGILLEVTDNLDPESTANARVYQIEHDWRKWDWSGSPEGLAAMNEVQRLRAAGRIPEVEPTAPEVSELAEQLCGQLWNILFSATGGHAIPRQDENAYYKWTLSFQRLLDGEVTGVAASATEVQVTLHTIQRSAYWMEKLAKASKNAGIYFVEHFAELRAGAATGATAKTPRRPQ